jgi:hypothetical protein
MLIKVETLQMARTLFKVHFAPSRIMLIIWDDPALTDNYPERNHCREIESDTKKERNPTI